MQDENARQNEQDLRGPNPAAMRAEAGAKAHQPQIGARGRRPGTQVFLQGEKHRRAAHVAVGAQYAGARFERVVRQRRLQRGTVASGVAKGSLYYPRIVASVLWLDE